MPIINGKYKNPGWVNNQQPPISAENLNDISTTLENLDAQGGGGKRVCRFVVGTSTAGWTAADCDYLCDGVDDNTEIQAALTALTGGGEVVLLDGTYHLGGPITVQTNVSLRGNGRATVLKRATSGGNGANGVLISLLSNCALLNLAYDGSGYPLAAGQSRIEIVLAGGCRIQGGKFSQCADTALCCETFGGFYQIDACSFESGVTAVLISCSGTVEITRNNFMADTIQSKRPSGTRVAPCVHISDNLWSSAGTILLSDIGNGSIVANNTWLRELQLLNTSDTVYSFSSSCLVSGNIFFPPSAGTTAIILGPGTGNNFISGNLLVEWYGAAPPKVEDNGTRNIVQFNSTGQGSGGISSQLVTLSASGWSSNRQMVTVQGVSANEAAQLITPVPTAASQTAYYNAGIKLTAQAANNLTFTAEAAPTATLSVYVNIQEVE